VISRINKKIQIDCLGADLFEFPGGTFDWLENRLSLLKSNGTPFKKIVFLQHHPYRYQTKINSNNNNTIKTVITKFVKE
jgi:hypothetical protein